MQFSRADNPPCSVPRIPSQLPHSKRFHFALKQHIVINSLAISPRAPSSLTAQFSVILRDSFYADRGHIRRSFINFSFCRTPCEGKFSKRRASELVEKQNRYCRGKNGANVDVRIMGICSGSLGGITGDYAVVRRHR